MSHTRRYIFALSLLSLCVEVATAQLSDNAVLNGVQGNDFTVTSEGKYQKFTYSQVNGTILSFKKNDVVQTGHDSFVNINIPPNGPTIKLAENSSIALVNSDPKNDIWSFNLIYGRILVNKNTDNTFVNIKTGNSVIQIRNGEINIDYTILPKVESAGKPVLSVSAISGDASVYPKYSDPGYARIALNNGETVVVDPFMGNIERFKMNTDIVDYWNKLDNKYGISNDLSKDETPIILPMPVDVQGTQVRKIGIITGLTLLAGGVIVQGAMHILESRYIEKAQADKIFFAGYVPIGLGSFVLLASYLF
ncbi:MAG: FecR domain-containing protein [Spirochaetaceae bacterium]|jgi:hypothetical protein|nr:FecR domain-containing protein [Spirochaetaceae bacterium]